MRNFSLFFICVFFLMARQANAQSTFGMSGKELLSYIDSTMDKTIRNPYRGLKGYIIVEGLIARPFGDDFNQEDFPTDESFIQYAPGYRLGLGAAAPFDKDFYLSTFLQVDVRGYDIDGLVSVPPTSSPIVGSNTTVVSGRSRNLYLAYGIMGGMAIFPHVGLSTGLSLSITLRNRFLDMRATTTILDTSGSVLSQFETNPDDLFPRGRSVDVSDLVWNSQLVITALPQISFIGSFNLDLAGFSIAQEGLLTSRNTNIWFGAGAQINLNWKSLGTELYEENVRIPAPTNTR